MDCYLREHPPRRRQFRDGRRVRPTGLTVLHTAENLTDFAGPSQGAESVAKFICNRAEPGSYHDIVDSDSCIWLVRYEDEAYHDGTGSNPYSLSISFALKAADWPRLSAERRAAFLAQGAQAFARQQEWLRANGHPPTWLRRVNRAQSATGESGFIGHGERDPGRRSDPGPGFPWAEWFDACAAATGRPFFSARPTVQEEDVARLITVGGDGAPIYGTNGLARWHVPTPAILVELVGTGVFGDGKHHKVSQATIDALPLTSAPAPNVAPVVTPPTAPPTPQSATEPATPEEVGPVTP